MSGGLGPRSRGAERRRVWRSHAGGGCGRGSPLPQRGSEGITPGKI
jgi:hypothetical protein